MNAQEVFEMKAQMVAQQARAEVAERTLREIASLIAPRVSTRFVTGDELADVIESVLGRAGVHLQDARHGRAEVKP